MAAHVSWQRFSGKQFQADLRILCFKQIFGIITAYIWNTHKLLLCATATSTRVSVYFWGWKLVTFSTVKSGISQIILFVGAHVPTNTNWLIMAIQTWWINRSDPRKVINVPIFSNDDDGWWWCVASWTYQYLLPLLTSSFFFHLMSFHLFAAICTA